VTHTLDLIPSAALARLLGIKPDTLVLWRANGKSPPFLRLGGRIYYRRAVVEAWLAEHDCAPSER
jgi:hypothetical protein